MQPKGWPASRVFAGEVRVSAEAGADALVPRPPFEPERKFISVLFADLPGSTDLIYGLDPEDALRLPNPIIMVMQEAVHRYQGTVSKEAGDGIVAFFGTPVSVDDHAARACLAALRTHGELQRMHGPQSKVRVGIHSGEVVLRQVSHDFTSIYDATGAVVHIAQKIEAKAPPGSTLISDACRALTGGRFDVERFKGTGLGGLKDDIILFELVGLRPMSRWQAKASAGLSKFVGRHSEMQTLEALARAAMDGTSCTIAIEGQPGAGKSRLAHEFLKLLAQTAWTSFEVEADPTAQQTSWGIARQLFAFARRRFRTTIVQRGIWNANGKRLSRPRRGAQCIGLGARHECRKCELAGGSARVSTSPHARGVRSRRFGLRSGSESYGGADRGSAMAQPPSPGMPWTGFAKAYSLRCACCSFFTRRRGGIESATVVVANIMNLSPLAQGETSLLLDELVGSDSRLKSLKQRIADHTGGIPFFVEEVVRRLADMGALASDKVGRTFAEIGIPPTVQGVIAARIGWALRSRQGRTANSIRARQPDFLG